MPSRCSRAGRAGRQPLSASKCVQLHDNGPAAPEISGPEITRITQIGRTTHESLGRTRKWLAGGHQRVQQGHQVGLTLGRRLRLHRKAFGAVARHSRGVTKSDAKKPLNSQNPPTLSQPRWEPSERPFPALSPAAHHDGSHVSVREGSERQPGGRWTYTPQSSRFCAERVLMAADRTGSTATCVPQSTLAARGSVA